VVYQNLLFDGKTIIVLRNCSQMSLGVHYSSPYIILLSVYYLFTFVLICVYIHNSFHGASAHEQEVVVLRHRRTERCTDCIQSQ